VFSPLTKAHRYVILLKILRGDVRKMVDKNTCIGCGSCINVCPVGAIKFDKDGKAEIDNNICIKCKTCENTCPVGAIKIKED